jgi:alanine dehydrogenase
MKKGAVIVDITCGYGTGYLPTGDQFTSFDHPVIERHGVLHCNTIFAVPSQKVLRQLEGHEAP